MSKIPRDVGWKQVANLLAKNGFKPVRQKGSHVLFKNQEGKTLTVPAKNPIKHGTLKAIIDQSGIPREKFLEQL